MKTFLTQEDINTIVESAPTLQDRLIIDLLWHTGIRVTELIGIRAEDIDWDNRLITIRHLKSRGEDRKRQVPIRQETLDLLHQFPVTAGLLFPVSRVYVYTIIRQAAEAAGFGGKLLTHPTSGKKHYVSPHRFRDALAMQWMNKHPDFEGMKALQDHLGHASINSTSRYLKLSPDHVKKFYDEIWD